MVWYTMLGCLAQLADSAASGAIAGAMVSAVVLLAKLLPWPNRKNGFDAYVAALREQNNKIEGLLHETRERMIRVETNLESLGTEMRSLPCAKRCPSERFS